MWRLDSGTLYIALLEIVLIVQYNLRHKLSPKLFFLGPIGRQLECLVRLVVLHSVYGNIEW